MEAPLVLQFSIALFTGMVAATFVPPVRKAIPKVVEVGLWLALFTACTLGVLSVTDANARELSASTLWGVDQVINTTAGILFGGVLASISDHRFAIATWLILLAGADIFALMLVRSIRSATPWQPRVRLREWMELPMPTPAPAPQPVVVADPLAGVNRRLAGAGALVAATMLARSLGFSMWARDAVRTRRLQDAAQIGASGSRARFESLRSTVAHIRFAASSWYVAAGRPAIEDVAGHAGDAMRAARAVTNGLRGAGPRPERVIDIRALRKAAPADSTRGDDDATDSQRPNTLAS